MIVQECELYTCEASYIKTKEMAQSSHEIKHAISGGLLRSVSVSTLENTTPLHGCRHSGDMPICKVFLISHRSCAVCSSRSSSKW